MHDYVGIGIIQKISFINKSVTFEVLALSPASAYGVNDPRFKDPHQLVVDHPLGGLHDVSHKLILGQVTILHHEKYFWYFPPESTVEALGQGEMNTRDLVSPGPDVYYVTYMESGSQAPNGAVLLSQISRSLLPTVTSSLNLSVFDVRHQIRLSISRLHNPNYGAPRTIRKVLVPGELEPQLLPGSLKWTTLRGVTGICAFLLFYTLRTIL
jgi:hypothetical protein